MLERRTGGWLFWPLLALLLSSRAFVRFTSSGLETSLAYLILALFFTDFLRSGPQSPRDVQRLLLLASLGVLTRLDLALLLLPASAAVLAGGLWRFRWSALRAALVATLPLAAWFGFALVYYGFLLPNSLYAKLPRAELDAGSDHPCDDRRLRRGRCLRPACCAGRAGKRRVRGLRRADRG